MKMNEESNTPNSNRPNPFRRAKNRKKEMKNILTYLYLRSAVHTALIEIGGQLLFAVATVRIRNPLNESWSKGFRRKTVLVPIVVESQILIEWLRASGSVHPPGTATQMPGHG